MRWSRHGSRTGLVSRAALSLLVAAGALLAVSSARVVAELQPGEVRAIQAREGSVLRQEPKAMGVKVGIAKYGARVTVTELQLPWAKVEADGGLAGWLRTSEIVEPGALTSAAARPVVYASDVSLAGRQFDDAVERDFKATEADIARAYDLVDAIERAALKPGDPQVEQFLREGHLGGGR